MLLLSIIAHSIDLLFLQENAIEEVEEEPKDRLLKVLSEIVFVILGFTFSIGAHSIFEEVARFSPLWFPRGKYMCPLSLVIDYYAFYYLR